MTLKKNEFVVCIDDNSPLHPQNTEPFLKLGELYQVVDTNTYLATGLTLYKVKNINTGEQDWFHAERFAPTKRSS